jgi:hypothetical protein
LKARSISEFRSAAGVLYRDRKSHPHSAARAVSNVEARCEAEFEEREQVIRDRGSNTAVAQNYLNLPHDVFGLDRSEYGNESVQEGWQLANIHGVFD